MDQLPEDKGECKELKEEEEEEEDEDEVANVADGGDKASVSPQSSQPVSTSSSFLIEDILFQRPRVRTVSRIFKEPRQIIL